MQVANHFGAQHAGDVRSGRGAAAGRDFLGHAATANDLAALKDESGISGARKIRGRRQAVVAGANNDRVVRRVVGTGHSLIIGLTGGQTIKSPVEENYRKAMKKAIEKWFPGAVSCFDRGSK